ncbi:MAG: hypothetical protein ACRCTP_10675 [Aeromonas popoffii]|uniref:hypothetical protein n=1 Tax=Aeromonas popoffii TaxID=70856 RepID=UPI003F2DA309
MVGLSRGYLLLVALASAAAGVGAMRWCYQTRVVNVMRLVMAILFMRGRYGGNV